MRFFIVLMVVLVLLLGVTGIATAQDDDPVPPTDDAPVIIENPDGVIEETLAWLFTLFGVWSVWSLSVKVTFDKIKDLALTPILELMAFTDDRLHFVRYVLVVMGVLVASFIASGQYNIFAESPFVDSVAADYDRLITTLFLAAGATIFHDAPTWLKR